jgi:hypothetical protein
LFLHRIKLVIAITFVAGEILVFNQLLTPLCGWFTFCFFTGSNRLLPFPLWQVKYLF